MTENKFQIIEEDALKRIFKQNLSRKFAFLLGAGCSITSGIPSANRCVWDWKSELYSSKEDEDKSHLDISLESTKREIQRWCDRQPNYPKEGDDSEYEFYVKECFPFREDRVAYFENICKHRVPSIGYKSLAFLVKKGIIRSVWTTNFDGITREVVSNYNVLYNEVTIEDKKSIFTQICKNNFLYVPLHGDYLKNELKNTEDELRNQESEFVSAMTHHFTETNLIIVGYSGRDNSLMEALKTAFSREGGRIYWCGREENPSTKISELLNIAVSYGRQACYVPIRSFDELMYSLLRFSFNDQETKDEILKLKKEFPNKMINIAPFKLLDTGSIVQYCQINELLVKIPYDCYTFNISIKNHKEANHLIEERLKEKFIVAKIFKGQVYAIGGYGEITNIFKDIILDRPIHATITKEDLKKEYMIRKLFLNAIILGIVGDTSLKTSFRDSIIWDISKKYDTNFYEAIKLEIHFNDKDNYAWLSLKPTLFSESSLCPILIKQNTIRRYVDSLKNTKYTEKISNWIYSLFGNNERIDLNFPKDNPEFKFTIRPKFPYVNIFGEGSTVYKPIGIPDRQIYFSGMRLREPELVFSAADGRYMRQTNPMRGLQYYMPFDRPSSISFDNSVKIGVICPLSYSSSFHSFLMGLNGSTGVTYKDYVQDFPGFEKAFNCQLIIPTPSDRNLWKKCKDSQIINLDLARNICYQAKEIAEGNPGAVIAIFLPSAWSNATADSDFNFHDYIKAYGAQNHFTTQIIKENTVLNNAMRGRIYWWISLALFVKGGRIPWTLGSLDEKTAYAGIGFSLQLGLDKKVKTVVGCSHLYNRFGQGLNFRLRKVDNPQFDYKNNPYLDEDEAYYFGLSIIELFRESTQFNPDRLVIHKRTPFKEAEIKGIVNAVSPYIRNVDLITIEREDSIRLTNLRAETNQFSPSTQPIRRGTCMIVDSNKALLWTQGCIDSIWDSRKQYYPGNKGVPAPLRIVRYHGTSSIEQLASEILSFTKINWNSFEFYSSMPATIDSSNLVARIGSRLHHYNGNTFEFRYFI